MAVKIENITLLKRYFEGVVERANHHAQGISEIIYALLGIIILKMDENTDLEVRQVGNDSMGNVLWVIINGITYTFRYEHSDTTIEIREGSLRGTIILKIDNHTSVTDILESLG